MICWQHARLRKTSGELGEPSSTMGAYVGAFQGDLSPLSSRSVLEVCVMPVLLNGCENWILTQALLERIESFQGELAKRNMKWPRHHSSSAAIVAVGVQSMRSKILERKLGFLRQVLRSGSRFVSRRVLEALCDDISSLCLVKEYRELEELRGVTFTDKILRGELLWGRNLKEEIRRVDHEQLLLRESLSLPRLKSRWDGLDYGMSC